MLREDGNRREVEEQNRELGIGCEGLEVEQLLIVDRKGSIVLGNGGIKIGRGELGIERDETELTFG